MKNPEICAIFAIGPNNVIGIGDKMPWHSKQDFYHYKQITKGYPCIFGERTFFGLPKYPLKDRLNIVVSYNYPDHNIVLCTEKNKLDEESYFYTGSYIEAPSVLEAIDFASNYSKIFICGGSSIYKYCLENDLVDTIYLTEVESEDLREKIYKDPSAYIKFPIDIQKYLAKNWSYEDIYYDPYVLPKEDNDILVKFTKWTKCKNR